MAGWIGVDLDGTLALYNPNAPYHPAVIGDPVPEMVARVKRWLADGLDVRIFTARVCQDPGSVARRAIQLWCKAHIGHALRVTCVKDYEMVELWDDRAVQVIANTGRRADGRAG